MAAFHIALQVKVSHNLFVPENSNGPRNRGSYLFPAPLERRELQSDENTLLFPRQKINLGLIHHGEKRI